MMVIANQDSARNEEDGRVLQALQSIERELYLFRMEMQESLKKKDEIEGQRGRKVSGASFIIAALIIALAVVAATSAYFFFNFLKDFREPKAIPAVYCKV